MSILIFFLVLFVLILVHEWGHFIVAKKTGMRVDEFGIGFPPKLFGKKWGETEYTFNALPIGGFVRILGENAESDESGVIDDRSFAAKSKWAQAAVLIAGVTMNTIFAWFLFVVIFMMGVPTAVEESQAQADTPLQVTTVLPDSPAAAAGIPVGAEIISLTVHDGLDSATAMTPSAFSDFVVRHSNSALELTYRAGTEETLVLLNATDNLLSENPEQPAVGVALSLIETVHYGIFDALFKATETTVSALGAITVGITNLLIDAVQFQADFTDVAGPVGIVGMVGDAADFGLASLLMFTAFISLNLAVINMLPFPALDGGRLVMVAIEAVIRRPINPVWVGRLNFVGFMLLILLMVAVTFSDIAKIL